MGIEISASGKFSHVGGAEQIRIIGGFGRMKILQKTFEMSTDFSAAAAGTNISASFIPAGSLVLGMAVKVIKAITTTGAPTALLVQSETPAQIYCSLAVTANAVALDATALQNGAVASASFYPAATNLDLGFTAGTTPTATDGRLRITMFYIQITA